MSEQRPPLPPFTRDTAIRKVRLAEDGWNSRDPARVALAYTVDSKWRNRAEFPVGREQIVEFLTRKWRRELDYRLIKELWAFADNRIAVRFAYEWHDDAGQLVSLLRQRELGVRRGRTHAAALRQHQRPADRAVRSQVLLAAGPTARRSPGAQRSRALRFRLAQLEALDLAGDCFRQLGHELDRAWILVRREQRLHMLLQLGDRDGLL